MKNCILLSLIVCFVLNTSVLDAQCSPTNCLSSLPAYGGVCDTLLSTDTVNRPYSDFESFHITTSCFDAGLISPANAGTGVIITNIDNFTFTGLPLGITGSPNQASYNSPANGCILFQGTPTEAGIFKPVINFLADVNAYPFGGGACSGFPIAQANNNGTYDLQLIILPDAGFTISSTSFCSTDAPVTLNITGTIGGTFSGPGVAGNTFDPSQAGAGTHLITYSVSAQQGAAVAPASNSSTITVNVSACLGENLQGFSKKTMIYPNPANNSIQISYFCSRAELTFSLMNSMGQGVMNEKNPGVTDVDNNTVRLNLGILPKGVYFLNVSEGDSKIKSYRVVISE